MDEELMFEDRKNGRMNVIVMTLLLLLLTSPGFSVIGSFIGSFVPNQRIAFPIVVLCLLGQNFYWKKDYILILSVAVFMALLIMQRITFYPTDRISETSDIGLIIFLVTLPAFIELFSRKKKYIFNSLLIVIYFQIAIAIFQTVAMSAGLHDTANMFDNYHRLEYKSFYSFPQIIGVFYRTSGTFIESSQYSIFLCFCYVCIDKLAISDNDKNIAKYTKYLIILAVLINYSITGYLMILSFLAVRPRQSLGLMTFLTPVIIVMIYFSGSDISEFVTVNQYLFQKIGANTSDAGQNSSEPEAERSNAFFNNIEVLFHNRLVFGYGDLKEEVTRWDFVSTYLYGYGVLGFTMMVTTVMFILAKAPYEYYTSLLFAFTTNGNLQTPMYLVILPIIFICKKYTTNRM